MKLKLLRKGVLTLNILLLLFSASFLSGQTPTITTTGKISDENDNGVNGVTVQVKGTANRTANRTATGADGFFTLRGLSGKERLVISSVG